MISSLQPCLGALPTATRWQPGPQPRKGAELLAQRLEQVPGVTSPILGVSKDSHVTDALAALDLELADEDIAEIEAPYRPHPVSGFV